MCALWQLSLDMPCVLQGLADCDCHPTHHDRFLRSTWLMDIRASDSCTTWRCLNTLSAAAAGINPYVCCSADPRQIGRALSLRR